MQLEKTFGITSVKFCSLDHALLFKTYPPCPFLLHLALAWIHSLKSELHKTRSSKSASFYWSFIWSRVLTCCTTWCVNCTRLRLGLCLKDDWRQDGGFDRVVQISLWRSMKHKSFWPATNTNAQFHTNIQLNKNQILHNTHVPQLANCQSLKLKIKSWLFCRKLSVSLLIRQVGSSGGQVIWVGQGLVGLKGSKSTIRQTYQSIWVGKQLLDRAAKNYK